MLLPNPKRGPHFGVFGVGNGVPDYGVSVGVEMRVDLGPISGLFQLAVGSRGICRGSDWVHFGLFLTQSLHPYTRARVQ